jgi:hypothetical protein
MTKMDESDAPAIFCTHSAANKFPKKGKLSFPSTRWFFLERRGWRDEIFVVASLVTSSNAQHI